MSRRQLNLLTLLSLLLCVAVCVLWARSIGNMSFKKWVRPELTVQVSEIDGVLGIMVSRDSMLSPLVRVPDPLGFFQYRGPIPPGRDRTTLMQPSFNAWGFGAFSGMTLGRPKGNWRIGGRRLLMVSTPYWLPALCAAVLPVVAARRFIRRRRRTAAGCCPTCGYDLRATPGRCPECGQVA